jgi:hypothetical protein
MAINKRIGTGLGVVGVVVAALVVSGAHGTRTGDRCEQEASDCTVWNSPDNPGFPRLPELIVTPRGSETADGR